MQAKLDRAHTNLRFVKVPMIDQSYGLMQVKLDRAHTNFRFVKVSMVDHPKGDASVHRTDRSFHTLSV